MVDNMRFLRVQSYTKIYKTKHSATKKVINISTVVGIMSARVCGSVANLQSQIEMGWRCPGCGP